MCHLALGRAVLLHRHCEISNSGLWRAVLLHRHCEISNLGLWRDYFLSVGRERNMTWHVQTRTTFWNTTPERMSLYCECMVIVLWLHCDWYCDCIVNVSLYTHNHSVITLRSQYDHNTATIQSQYISWHFLTFLEILKSLPDISWHFLKFAFVCSKGSDMFRHARHSGILLRNACQRPISRNVKKCQEVISRFQEKSRSVRK